MLNSGPTMIERCRRVAQDYQSYMENTQGYWVAVARNEEWPNPNEPAVRHGLALKLPGILLYAYVHYGVPCMLDPNGDIETGEKKYKSLATTEYMSLVHAKAHFMYYEAEVAGAILYREQDYRIFALCHKVRLGQGVSVNYRAGSILYPEQVSYYEPLWVASFLKVEPTNATLHRLQILRAY